MLVLTRKIDQGIVISGNILVRVLGVERDRVKIGISAPLNVTVLRQELLERDANSNEADQAKASLSHAKANDDVSAQA
jgi:carbon storage regulator